jgi:CheY-like chemotaxis protein
MSLARVSVLAVEDDSDFSFVLASMLESIGVQDLVLVDGVPSALAALAGRSFDILLTDLRLGDKSGLDLVQGARAGVPAQRIVLISAHASAHDVEEARALGVVEFLTKPFTAERLATALRKAMASAVGLWGEVQELSLVDMLQMYHYGRKSLTLTLSGEVDGRISFIDGEIVDAAAGDQRGLTALSRLLRMTTGRVNTDGAPETTEATIGESFQNALLEALRQLDEGKVEHRDPTETEIEAALGSLAGAASGHLDSPNPSPAARRGAPKPRASSDPTKNNRPEPGETIMATEKQLQETLQQIQAEVAGFIGASVVDLETGMTLAAYSTRADFDLSTASAYNSEMVKQKLKIIKALNLNTSLEDMLLTLGDQIHLIRVITPNTFIYMAAERGSTNLAIARSVVAKHVPDLQ